ncbi:apolipoprotein N-acyltransferase [Fervidobacterium riparium]|uniref:apolipoprotein N-acyltransferase n=1 Tax=Fervidobacterium gondwanense TaxID=44754 RepID=UPI00393FE122
MGEILNILIASLLTTLSMPGYLYGGLVFFALIPLFFSLERKGPILTALSSFLYFFIFSFVNFHYLINTLTTGLPELFGRFGPTAGFFVYLLFCVLEALPFLLFGFLYGLWAERIKYRFLQPLFVASAYTLSEYLRGIGDLGFTGGRLSDALYNFTGILQLLSITGTLGLVFVIVVINYESYRLLKKSKANLLVMLSIFVIIISGDGIIERFIPKIIGDKPVVLAQTNVPQKVKYSYSSSEIVDYIKKQFSDTPEYMTIFPEAVFPGTDIRNSDVEKELLEIFSKRIIVVGFPTLDEDKAFNSAVIYSNGSFLDKYDKVKLFPFVEMLPYGSIFGSLSFLKGMYYFSPGTLKDIDIPGYGKIGFEICFESFFPNLSRKLARDVGAIVVITNDGWYNSRIPLQQHFVQSIFRAIETRRYVIQVSNTGISGVVDIFGNYTQLPYGTISRTMYISINTQETFYIKFGEYIVLVSLFIIILSGLTLKKKNTIFD